MSDPIRYCSFFLSCPSNWQPCSKEHHDMVKAHPHEWPGYEVRALTAIPADQVLVPRELLEQLLGSDGIDGVFDASKNYEARQKIRTILHP